MSFVPAWMIISLGGFLSLRFKWLIMSMEDNAGYLRTFDVKLFCFIHSTLFNTIYHQVYHRFLFGFSSTVFCEDFYQLTWSFFVNNSFLHFNVIFNHITPFFYKQSKKFYKQSNNRPENL